MWAALTGTALRDHVGKWNVAVLASDVFEFLNADDATLKALRQLLEKHVDAEEAWWRVSGSRMHADVKSHLDLRLRMKPGLHKPLALAHLLARWMGNASHLDASPSAAYDHVAKRLCAFGALLSSLRVSAVAVQPSVCQTQASLLPLLTYEWALAASMAALLHVLPTAAAPTHMHLAPMVGSVTAPATHEGVELVDVTTGTLLPVEANGCNKYGVLVATLAGDASILVCHASRGQVEEIQVVRPQSEEPRWVTRSNKHWLVGFASLVGAPAGPWTVHASLPLSGPMSKMGNVVVWRGDTGLLAFDGEQNQVVGLDDQAALQSLLVERAHTAVGAQGKCVFAEGVPLFRLPDAYTDMIACVSKSSATCVDVFTLRGDWWRVHVPSRTASVVGLGLASNARIVDTCVY